MAEEGINGTLSSTAQGIEEIMAFIKKDPRVFGYALSNLCHTRERLSIGLGVVVRKEIVTLGDSSVNPNEQVGTYVEPEQWNQIVEDPANSYDRYPK